ncbi:MAG: glycosyltransferase [Candidatus Eisenbacteria sp.]|nr:glycosyltransferase [Candidatus Eisenbacteria bacterium]
MAKILLVKHLFPYPPSQGTRRVSLALLGDLATRHEVVYLCQLEHPGERELVPKIERLGVRVVAPLMPNHRTPVHRLLYKIKNRALSRLQDIPEVCYYWSNIALRTNLERLQDEFAPELTILENWETFPLRRSIKTGIAALLAHDAAFQILERAVAATTDPRERARRARALEQQKRLEIAAWGMYEAVMTLTESDRETIEQELGLPDPQDSLSPGLPPIKPIVRHLPVPVPGEFFDFSRPATPGKRVGFLGTFRAHFNRDALEFLLQEIWPELSWAVPDARLVIAGNGYQGRLKTAAERAGARWMGFVHDLDEFFQAIDVLLVPLRFGGGVRIRILEALAAGVPIVATPVALAGLAARPEEHLLLGADAAEIAGQIEWLFANPREAAAMGARGRAWCREAHGPEALRPRRLAVIDEILALRSAAGDARRHDRGGRS